MNDKKTVALILAGYNKINNKKKYAKEIKESYDGEEIYIGENKFLYQIMGKPVIQYVLDAVYNAKINGKRIYEKIYVYNDIKSFQENIDVSQYKNLEIRQMTSSVAGHFKDFYPTVEYGCRVDIYFGDAPRITPEDVKYIYDSFGKILNKQKDHRGVTIKMTYGIVRFDDMKDDNWLPHRIKYFKHGKKKGKLKSFVGFLDGPARIGNCASMIKHHSIDGLIDHNCSNFVYNLRKALTPSVISKLTYYLITLKKYHVVKQIRKREIIYVDAYQTFIDLLSKLFKLDLSEYAGSFFTIKQNAARWENDVDGPQDLSAMKKKFSK